MAKKRKPSAYNLHVGREMKKGKTMKQAAASYKGKKKGGKKGGGGGGGGSSNPSSTGSSPAALRTQKLKKVVVVGWLITIGQIATDHPIREHVMIAFDMDVGDGIPGEWSTLGVGTLGLGNDLDIWELLDGVDDAASIETVIAAVIANFKAAPGQILVIAKSLVADRDLVGAVRLVEMIPGPALTALAMVSPSFARDTAEMVLETPVLGKAVNLTWAKMPTKMKTKAAKYA